MKNMARSILLTVLLFGLFAGSSFAAMPKIATNPDFTNNAIEKKKTGFFDEADALFGKRTEVRDSHDKYANQEVSY